MPKIKRVARKRNRKSEDDFHQLSHLSTNQVYYTQEYLFDDKVDEITIKADKHGIFHGTLM